MGEELLLCFWSIDVLISQCKLSIPLTITSHKRVNNKSETEKCTTTKSHNTS
jgi:hypothetical protein